MNLSEAKTKFSELFLNVNTESRHDFITWIKNSEELDDFLSDSRIQMLDSIAEQLRAVIPRNGVLDGETLFGLDDPKSAHIDAFLFPDDVLDDYCDEGKMSRYYCKDCGSKRTQRLDLYSHSFSAWELKWLFTKILPPVDNKTILDVGSRHGAVLYGASEFTNASKIIGVEMNADFCTMTNRIAESYKYDRIEIIQGDIRVQTALLTNADVIILNNVFENFLSNEDQIKCWDVIFGNVNRSGQVLVTVPSIQESLDSLKGKLPSGWIEEINFELEEELVPDECDLDSLKDIHLYRVL